MATRIHIAIAEPSVIIRSGLVSVLQKSSLSGIDLAEIDSIASLSDSLGRLKPDILIINPTHLGLAQPSSLRKFADREDLKVVALQTTLTDPSTLSNYNAAVSIHDTGDTIRKTLLDIISDSDKDEAESKNELSAREKEIVVCVARGMTNKEIADQLYLSTHTIISHRRNIAAKLEIHSASGLTIYAIVNKLIDSESLMDSLRG